MTYAQPQADPTNVVGRRIGAYAIDLVLMALVIAAFVVPVFISALETDTTGVIDCTTGSSFDDERFDENSPAFCFDDGDDVRYVPQDEEGTLTAQVYGIAFLVQALNLLVLQGLTGASLGKLILGLRVIRTDGRKAGIGWAALRWILLFVDSFCFFLPGAILVFVTKGHRRLGDMAAGTFVVRKEHVGAPPQVPGVTGPATWAPTGGGYGAAPGGSWPAGPAAPGGWTPPAGPTPPSSTWAPGGDAAAAPSGEGPTWDGARNAYIQYDRDRSAWVQWDDTTKEWRPIDQ